jgi:putative adenylyl cyclase cyaB
LNSVFGLIKNIKYDNIQKIKVRRVKMASRIELEASYHLGENYEDILEKIEEQNFKLVEDSVEEDTYFTDKNLEFVKSRTCLRTRKTNEDFLELTYKPKTDNSTEKYGKKEVNLRLDPKDYEDTKYVINQLGYIEYVSFKKYRQVYSKNINGFEYNIMIDKIDGVGNFIELEILANTEEEKEKLRTELDKFVERMNCNKLKEKEKPYRDIVKEHMDRKK